MSHLCDQWFKEQPNLGTFVLRAIFGDLSEAWDDNQGIAVAMAKPFDEILLPELEELFSSEDGFLEPKKLDKVVTAFRDSQAAAALAKIQS